MSERHASGEQSEMLGALPILRNPVPIRVPAPNSSGFLGYLLVGLFLCCILTLAVGLWKVGDLLERAHLKLASVRAEPVQLQQHREQLQSLQTRAAKLIAASVEAKLVSLEKSLDSGKLTTEDLRNLEAVTGEIKFLQEHAAELAIEADVFESPEHQRFRVLPDTSKNLPTHELLNEIAEWKGLIYIALFSASLGVAVCGGIWLSQAGRWSYLALPRRRALPVLEKCPKDCDA